MPKNRTNTDVEENRKSSDSNNSALPILNQESEVIGARIKEAIGNESIRSFSRRCSISNSLLSAYTRGEKTPGSENLAAIAKAAGVTTDWLTTGKGEKSRRAYVTLSAGAGKTNTSLLAIQTMAEYKPDTPTRNTKPTPTLIEKLLQPSLAALQLVHGDQFKAEPASLQLDYAMNLSDLLIGLAAGAPDDRSPLDVARLSIDDLAAQLRVFLALGWARTYSPPGIYKDAPFAW